MWDLDYEADARAEEEVTFESVKAEVMQHYYWEVMYDSVKVLDKRLKKDFNISQDQIIEFIQTEVFDQLSTKLVQENPPKNIPKGVL